LNAESAFSFFVCRGPRPPVARQPLKIMAAMKLNVMEKKILKVFFKGRLLTTVGSWVPGS